MYILNHLAICIRLYLFHIRFSEYTILSPIIVQILFYKRDNIRLNVHLENVHTLILQAAFAWIKNEKQKITALSELSKMKYYNRKKGKNHTAYIYRSVNGSNTEYNFFFLLSLKFVNKENWIKKKIRKIYIIRRLKMDIFCRAIYCWLPLPIHIWMRNIKSNRNIKY